MAGKKWSEEEKQAIVKGINEGKRCEDIANEIGRTVRSTQHMFATLGLGTKKRNKVPEKGDKFGRLEVVSQWNEFDGKYHISWCECKCECGKEFKVRTNALHTENTTSCGCYRKEVTGAKNRSHGLRWHKLYKVLQGMKTRCYNSNSKFYKYYGGKGVKIYDIWKNNFKSFYDWSINNGWKEGLTIDRIDINGNYEPKNCRWTTYHVQAMNRSTTIRKQLTAWGETKDIHDWLVDSRCVVQCSTLCYRIGSNWTVEEALTTPSLRKKRKCPTDTEPSTNIAF